MTPSDPDFPDWETLYVRQQAAEAAAIRSLLLCCTPLAAQQVSRVVFYYEGSGDSGEATRMLAYDRQHNVVPVLFQMGAELMALADELIPVGYEINTGSRGEISLDVLAKQIRHEHLFLGAQDETSEIIYDQAFLDRD